MESGTCGQLLNASFPKIGLEYPIGGSRSADEEAFGMLGATCFGEGTINDDALPAPKRSFVFVCSRYV